MAKNQTRTRTWSVPTSPRNPFKLQDELMLIAEFEGRLWNRDSQLGFAKRLAESDFYEGAVSENHADFAARDRVNRAPKTFGFVRLTRGVPLEVTAAGWQLMEGRGTDDLLLRQLLKWQYPSPNHHSADYRELFCVRPFLEMLRLARDLDGLSKEELALFGVPLIRYQDYDTARADIQQYRAQRAQRKGRVERGALLLETFERRVREIYAADIAGGSTATRESSDATLKELVRVKRSNLRDYADSAMRYFLATGLFTLSDSGRMYRLQLLPERRAEADVLLRDTPRDPDAFEIPAAREAFYARLGDPRVPQLPGDNLPILRGRVQTLFAQVAPSVRALMPFDAPRLKAEADALVLREWEALLRREAEREAAAVQQNALQQAEAVDDIIQTFEQIRLGDVPDRPLFFEWNVWRALSALDDGAIRNNFEMDRLGQPRKQAPGGGADIVGEYAGFHLAVEVTLSSGATQYKMEGEPVNRHVGLLQKSRLDAGDQRPVYGLFIAPNLNPTVVAHFYAQHRTRLKIFGGTVHVVPLALSDFLRMLEAARPYLPSLKSTHLHEFMARARELANNSEDEEQWHQEVRALLDEWPQAA